MSAGWRDDTLLWAEPGIPAGRAYAVEPDASAASYFLTAAAIYTVGIWFVPILVA